MNASGGLISLDDFQIAVSLPEFPFTPNLRRSYADITRNLAGTLHADDLDIDSQATLIGARDIAVTADAAKLLTDFELRAPMQTRPLRSVELSDSSILDP